MFCNINVYILSQIKYRFPTSVLRELTELDTDSFNASITKHF